jgi:hypothetical protein
MPINYTILIRLPKYLDDWLRHEFWDDASQRIIFPRGSAEHTVLALFIKRRPAGYIPVTNAESSDLIPIQVPQQSGKNPDTFNYLPEAGVDALKSTIRKRFKMVLWNELSVLFNEDVQISDIIYAFMENHGISDDPKNWETIRQMYLRLRKTYQKRAS